MGVREFLALVGEGPVIHRVKSQGSAIWKSLSPCRWTNVVSGAGALLPGEAAENSASKDQANISKGLPWLPKPSCLVYPSLCRSPKDGIPVKALVT